MVSKLDELPPFHDTLDLLGVGDVLQRIGLENQQVSEIARLDGTDLLVSPGSLVTGKHVSCPGSTGLKSLHGG